MISRSRDVVVISDEITDSLVSLLKVSCLICTVHYHCLVSKLYNFNTLKRYVEVIVIVDLSAIKTIYENKNFFYQETGNSNLLN